ncbi:hypothetical protein FZ103_00680 [Streptomonospora sp. PA3]|uniref:hypothetical protein n=1 Tax=Streptomonospora sp. PA3 TaxID=2607326 RepID=UPI0012DDBFAC|nr:hypothetical protein [Streptomonospora sp. PA3]MUL39707.1 hypothetical protein [Streptomonospora sp. PA3]
MTTDRVPSPPNGAGASGRKLWCSIVEDYDLDAHEELLLVQAVRCVDRLDEMAAALAEAPLTATNRHGDEVPHPLLVESRQQSITLTRLLASMRLPSGEDDGARRPQRRGAARGAYGFRDVA